MKKILSVSLGIFLLFVGCASQRQKPVCAEIEYRLNHTAMSPDQRQWTKKELDDCRAEQQEYAKSDTMTNKFKKSIYEMYEDSKKDSASVDSLKTGSAKPDSIKSDSAQSDTLSRPVAE